MKARDMRRSVRRATKRRPLPISEAAATRQRWLAEADVTQAAMAETLGMSPAGVSKVMLGRDRSSRVETLYCQIVKRPYAECWPDHRPVWRDPNGKAVEEKSA